MKIVCGVKYVHCSNVNELSDQDIDLVEQCKNILAEKNKGVEIDYTIIKIDSKNKSVSFIECEDFDTANEPTVGDAYKITLDGECKITKKKKNPQIYHHKWSFVNINYTGFDYKESVRRSYEWGEKLKGVNKSKIGYKDYWVQCLKSVGMDV